MWPASRERGHVVNNTMVSSNPALCMAEGLQSLASPSPSRVTTAQRGAGQCPVWREPSRTVPSSVAVPLATCGYLNLKSLNLNSLKHNKTKNSAPCFHWSPYKYSVVRQLCSRTSVHGALPSNTPRFSYHLVYGVTTVAEAFPPANVSMLPVMTGTGTDNRVGGNSKIHALILSMFQTLLHASYLYYI